MLCFKQMSFKILKGYTSWRACSSSSSFSSSSGSETVGHYDHLVQCGSLRKDAQQRHVLQQLAQLQHTLKTYSNSKYLNPPPQRLDPKDDKSQHQQDKDPNIMTYENKGDTSTDRVTKNIDIDICHNAVILIYNPL